MKKLAEIIVKQKSLILILFIAAIIYSVFGLSKVNVSYDITSFLDPSTDTYRAIEIMSDEFTEYGSSKIMVKNISYADAEALAQTVRQIPGVKSLPFAQEESYYKEGNALFTVTFSYESDNELALRAYDSVIETLSGRSYTVASGLRNSFASDLAKSMLYVLLLAIAVIAAVLLFTSKSYAEIAAFPVVFVVAGLLNMGTNFWFGTISFITYSIAIILQLALAIDYSIIVCHSFMAAKQAYKDPKKAMIHALASSIPEIGSSSLTTISGLIALVFMNLRIGADLGFVLAKGIIFSILTVLLLMPALLLALNKPIEKTMHKNFVPKISAVGRYGYKSRKVVPFVFIAIIATAGVLQTFNTYSYSDTAIDSFKKSAGQTAAEEVDAVFGTSNLFAVLVPQGDHASEREIVSIVLQEDMVDYGIGLAAIEFADGYYITDALDYSTLSQVSGISSSTLRLAYMMYAMNVDNWSAILNLGEYKVPVIDMVRYVLHLYEMEYITPDADTQEMLDAIGELIQTADEMLIGANYSRLVFNIDGPAESAEVFAMIARIDANVKALRPDAILAGSSMSSYDLDQSFTSDNIKISVLTLVFILIILLFTFRSAGLAVVLILTIQGAIFINFALPFLIGSNVFFFAYLVVSAIQMGATIDYAIVLTNKFNHQKLKKDHKTAMVDAVNESFPTIATSGSILVIAAFLVAFMVNDPMISSIGLFLGIGSLISVLCVLFVLPANLLLFDKVIEKTSFGRRSAEPVSATGQLQVQGRVKGEFHGYIDAEVKGRLKGEGTFSLLPAQPHPDPLEQAEPDAVNAQDLPAKLVQRSQAEQILAREEMEFVPAEQSPEPEEPQQEDKTR